MVQICEFVGTLAVAGKVSKTSSRSSEMLMATRPLKVRKSYDIVKKVIRANRLRINDISTQRGRRECSHLSPMSLQTLRTTGE
jgi:hypothetical protein